MSHGQRRRNRHLHVMVSPDELDQIHARMDEAGIHNAGAYLRKMALNGYIVHVDLAPVRELVSLQRRCANNMNRALVRAIAKPAWQPGSETLTLSVIY